MVRLKASARLLVPPDQLEREWADTEILVPVEAWDMEDARYALSSVLKNLVAGPRDRDADESERLVSGEIREDVLASGSSLDGLSDEEVRGKLEGISMRVASNEAAKEARDRLVFPNPRAWERSSDGLSKEDRQEIDRYMARVCLCGLPRSEHFYGQVWQEATKRTPRKSVVVYIMSGDRCNYFTDAIERKLGIER